MHFKGLPKHLKPREKAMSHGIKSLDDIELLALFLKTGTLSKDVLELSKELISRFNGIKHINSISDEELLNIKGIGNVKLIELRALFEFSSRISVSISDRIDTIEEASKMASQAISYSLEERMFVILLNISNELILAKTVSIGSEEELSINPKKIVSLCLKNNAKKFYCFHNHPSGDLSASDADQSFTARLNHYSNLFGIKMLGHIVLNKKGEHKLIT